MHHTRQAQSLLHEPEQYYGFSLHHNFIQACQKIEPEEYHRQAKYYTEARLKSLKQTKEYCDFALSRYPNIRSSYSIRGRSSDMAQYVNEGAGRRDLFSNVSNRFASNAFGIDDSDRENNYRPTPFDSQARFTGRQNRSASATLRRSSTIENPRISTRIPRFINHRISAHSPHIKVD